MNATHSITTHPDAGPVIRRRGSGRSGRAAFARISRLARLSAVAATLALSTLALTPLVSPRAAMAEESGESGVSDRPYAHYWRDYTRQRPSRADRVQSYDPTPGYAPQQPRYPNGVTQRWVPGHMVGGYLRGGVWVPERWIPGRMVEVLEID